MVSSSSSNAPKDSSVQGGPRQLGILWVGQFVSLLGSTFSRFAFAVWVYQQTGSATQFSLIALCTTVPGLVLSPLAGAWVDRWDRRRVLLVTSGLSALTSAVLGLTLIFKPLSLPMIWAYALAGSAFTAFQILALSAATTVLVPRRHLARASSLLGLVQAFAGVLGPLPAPWLLGELGLVGVVWLDFGTFVVAVLALLVVRIPRPPQSAAGRAARGSLGHQIRFGWQFIRERPGLLGLLNFFAVLNLISSMTLVLVPPLVLSFAPKEDLSYVQACSGAGLILGSLVMTITGGPARKIHGIVWFGFLQAVALVVVGLRPSIPWIAGGLFVLLAGLPVINGCSQAIWQAKVPADVQGRVFAVRRVLAQLTQPLGQLSGGPLADFVFIPLLLPSGALAGSVGTVFGVGPGRGIGLLFALVAVVPAVASLWTLVRPRVRQVEDELPDAVP